MRHTRALLMLVLSLVLVLPLVAQAVPYWGGARLNGNKVDFDFAFDNDTTGSNIERLLLDGNPVGASFQSLASETLPPGVTSTAISGWGSSDVSIDFLPANEFNPTEQYVMIGVKVTGVGKLALADLVGMQVTFVYDNVEAVTFSFAQETAGGDLTLQQESSVLAPEPSTSLLLGLGLIGLTFYRWRVRKQVA